MSGILASVDEQTNLVGENRLELLLFRLKQDQLYGINVFKVREVLQCPNLTLIPKRNPVIRGLAHIRGGTIPVIDLNAAIGYGLTEDIDCSFMIITEYNQSIQGFLVGAVERIINLNWQVIRQPPYGIGNANYLTAVSEVNGTIIEVLDVEKILIEIEPNSIFNTNNAIIPKAIYNDIISRELKVLIAEDSQVARKALRKILTEMGIEVVTMKNGKEAWTHLLSTVKSGVDINSEYVMMISDIEMPEMDGYTLTTEIRQNAQLEKLYIILHTSMSGCFNQAMVDKVGADKFLAKFQQEDLIKMVLDRVQDRFDIDYSASLP